MTCNRCGAVLELVDQSGGTKSGEFTEEYECVECGGRGMIAGDAGESPRGWRQTGVCGGEA